MKAIATNSNKKRSRWTRTCSLLPVLLLACAASASNTTTTDSDGVTTSTTTVGLRRRRGQESFFGFDRWGGKPSTSYSCGAAGELVSVPAGEIVSLARSSANFICELKEAGLVGRKLARSYNGGQWEAVISRPNEEFINVIGCKAEACTVQIPQDPDTEYVLVSIQGRGDFRNPKQKLNEISRFLRQTTFGPTLDEIHSFTGTYEEWIQKQMDLPPSLHRAFFRQYMNFEKRFQPPRPDKVCQFNARWSRVPLGAQDDRKQIERVEVEDSNTVVLKVDGVPRTERSKGQWPAKYNNWYAFGISGSGGLRIKRTMKRGNGDAVPIGSITFVDTQPDPATVVQFEGDCHFIPIENVPSVIFKGGDNCQCTMPEFPNNKVFLAQVDGEWLRFEDMDSYNHNTLEEPDPTGCATAQPHPVNIDHCIVVQGSCRGLQYSPSNRTSPSCGSPGEVRAIPELGALFRGNVQMDSYDGDHTIMSGPQGKPKTIWIKRTISAEDQLRQRVAFALSSLWVADLRNTKLNEPTMAFYDIFVRNAFGNYLDVMRQVTYSKPMAQYLTYKGSLSFASSGYEPDENYARELMQLFTLGLHKMHTNFTLMRDEVGNPIRVYSELDIETMARVWTGFDDPVERPSNNAGMYESSTDPLRIDPRKHDQFPKINLDGGYIGDSYPLCYDLPSQHFLKKGAIYEFYSGDEDYPTVHLEEGTPLYEALCNRTTAVPGTASSSESPFATTFDASRSANVHSCDLKPRIILAEHVVCDGLCEYQTLDLVQIGTATYRYIGRPCVTFPFFNQGEETRDGFCRDPSWKTSCCGSQMQPDNFAWNAVACSPKVQIAPDGQIAIFHHIESANVDDDVNGATSTFFRVAWAEGTDDLIPSPGSCGVCQEHHDTCICDIQEIRQPVFNAAPSREEMFEKLHVGSVPPDAFAKGEYVFHSFEQNGVTVFRKATGTAYDMDTIFAIDFIPGHPEPIYLRNVESDVSIVGIPGLKFRNTPMFNNINRRDNKDTLGAYQEIDAVLEYLLNHPNIAPFVSYRFIQRFVTSNPSPAYVERVSRSFESGRFGAFGTGKRGDLAATIAAVLLDADARSTLLDADPIEGQLREPLLKLMHGWRSLEFYQTNGRFFGSVKSIHELIRQFVYELPSVFSFFEPGFTRAGTVLEREGLVSPESYIVGYSETFSLLGLLASTLTWDGASSRFTEKATPGDLQEFADNANLILTGGRVSDDDVQYIIDTSVSTPFRKETWEEKMKRIIMSFLLATEFHASNVNNVIAPQAVPPPPPPPQPSPAKDFKAIVVIDLNGGADSMNMLIPHSECQGEDLYERYLQVRPEVALEKSAMNVIDVPPGQQECNKFGMPVEMRNLYNLYQSEELTWVSNVGALTGDGKPVYDLNSHPNMMTHVARGWANAKNNTGVLGRLSDVLSDQHYRVGKFSLAGFSGTLVGDPERSPPTNDVGENGVPQLGYYYKQVYNVTNPGTSLYSHYYRKQLDEGLVESARINQALKGAAVGPGIFPESRQDTTILSAELEQAAKLIQVHDTLGVDRALLRVKRGGWDSHKRQPESFSMLTKELDDAVGFFVEELRRIGKFNDTVIMIRSEFGRKHSSNSGAGTDHGWNGNYFVVGGSVKGGQVLGEYPELKKEMPKHSWESLYYGIFDWFGVLPHQWDEVLPRHMLFNNLIPREKIMKN